MVSVDDVAVAVLTRLAAVASHATTCPGGHWFDRGPETPAGYPYDVFRIRAGRTTLTTGAMCVQTYTVEIAGYCPVGDTPTNISAVEQLFLDALVTQGANTALQAIVLRNATEKILASRVVQNDGKYDPLQRSARDVWVAGLTAELIVQSDRSVS